MGAMDRRQRMESPGYGGLRQKPLKDTRILLVEDELLFGWGLQTALYEAGCNAVRLVTTIQDALKELSLWRPDAAVLDMRLRDGNLSLPVADVLDDHDIAFLFVSGHPPDVVTPRHRQREFIGKPCSVDSVVAALVQIVEGAPKAP